jgi:hypothetical protein
MSAVTNPSIKKTLGGLKARFDDVYGGTVDVYTEIPSIPFLERTPALIITEYRQVVCRILSGFRGNPKTIPNLYSFVLLEGPAKTSKTGKTVGEVVSDLRDKVDLLIESFRFDSTLGGVAMCAGTCIEIHYDRYGPYIKYFGDAFIGCMGIIDVEELYRANAHQ